MITKQELRTLLPNQMIKQPDIVKTTEKEYLLITNTEPIQTPVLETVDEPDGIITIPTQQPEEQKKLLKILYESGLITKEECIDDYSKLRMDKLPTDRILLPDKVQSEVPPLPQPETLPVKPSLDPGTLKNVRNINPVRFDSPPTYYAGFGKIVNQKGILPPPPMARLPAKPCVPVRLPASSRMAPVTIWIGEDPARYTSAPPKALNGCRRPPIVYNPYLPKKQLVAKPTNCPPATKKPTNGPPATKKLVNSPPVIKKTKTVKPEPVPDEKKDEKGRSSSWFSWGHWLNWQNKVYPMKLPDDTNPTIIWDLQKGCWVDTEKQN